MRWIAVATPGLYPKTGLIVQKELFVSQNPIPPPPPPPYAHHQPHGAPPPPHAPVPGRYWYPPGHPIPPHVMGGVTPAESRWLKFRRRVTMELARVPMAGKLAWLGLVLSPILLLKLWLLPFGASQAVDNWSAAYDMDLEVGGWTTSVRDLSATAEDVVLRVRGPFDQKELVTASELEIDLSLWRGLREGQWGSSITLRSPKVYLERRVGGRWNWEDLAVAPPEPPARGEQEKEAKTAEEEALFFFVPNLFVEDLELAWVEQLPGKSGGGLVHNQKATLFIDDVEIVADSIQGIYDPRDRASRLTIEGRTGDGQLSIDGDANFFHWSGEVGDPLAWRPSFELTAILENLGVGAFARLTPDSPLAPSRGSMSGRIKVELEDGVLTCDADLDLVDVAFEVNRDSPLLPDSTYVTRLEREVADLRGDGRARFDCGGSLEGESFRPVQAFHTAMVQQVTMQSTTIVQTFVLVDAMRYQGGLPIPAALQRDVARVVGGLDPDAVRGLAEVHETVRDLGIALPGGVPRPGRLPVPSNSSGGQIDRLRRFFGGS